MGRWTAWPFAVAPHWRAGYSSVLVPPTLPGYGVNRDMLFLLEGVPEGETPPAQVWARRVVTPAVQLCVLFRCWHVRKSSDERILDKSRPVPLYHGVVFESTPPYRSVVRALRATERYTRAAFWAFWVTSQATGWPKDSVPGDYDNGSIPIENHRPETAPEAPLTVVTLAPLERRPATEATLTAAKAAAVAGGTWRFDET